MTLTDRIINNILSGNFDVLKKDIQDGNLSGVRWSWITRKSPSISLEHVYQKVFGLDERPKCLICKKRPVSTFISFEKGYNKYCSKSCAKQDPLVEHKKKQTLSKNPLWKEQSVAKAKQTNIHRYGAKAPLGNVDLLQKRKSTNILKYGVPEVLSAGSEIRKRIVANIPVNKVFSRIKSFNHVVPLFDEHSFDRVDARYAWRCTSCQKEFLATLNDGNIPRCTRCNPRTSSTGENELRKFVESLVTSEVIQRYRINGIEIDIYIPALKLGIEFNGIYWHSEKTGTPKNYHRDKKQKCTEMGITLLQFWDSQWETKQDIIKSIIAGHIGLHDKLYARQCSISSCSEQVASTFLDENHLSGNARGAMLRLALKHKDEVVMIATFAKPRFSKKPNEIELLRLCSRKNLMIIGGASRLLKKAIKLLQPNTIISFCDEMCFSGKIYRVLGFKQVNTGKPASWYFGADGKLKHRTSYQKKRLLQLLKLESSECTEWELAQQLKLNRVWDCGSSKWKLDVVFF